MSADVVFLMGPTASGKTGLAELLYQELDCEIISVDSSAVYRGMDIGSAKPDAELQARMPHRLIDIREPSQTYSAADFIQDALQAIEEVHARGNTALLVGGTMLYFKALRDGLAELPAASPELRAEIEAQAEAEGWAAVHAELAKVDAVAAERIHPNDPQRLQRALEVYRLTGQPMSELQQGQATAHLQSAPLQISVEPQDRALLHARIEQRFDQMLAQGLVEEVRELLRAHADRNLPAFRAVGYRQVVEYLHGELSEQEMRERGIIASRQLAKRQITWMRSWPGLQKLYASAEDYANGLQIAPSWGTRSIFQQAVSFFR